MKNKYIVPVLVGIVSLGFGFIVGTKYQMSKTPSLPQGFAQRQIGQRSSNGGEIAQISRPTRGKIIDISDSSITVSLEEGNSKIILLSDTTSINKAQTGTRDDLVLDTEIVVMGSNNSDGSITAQNIQIGTGGFGL